MLLTHEHSDKPGDTVDIGLIIALSAFALYALAALAGSRGFWSYVGNLILGLIVGSIMHFIVGGLVGIVILIYLGLSGQGDKSELGLIARGVVTAISFVAMGWLHLKDAAESTEGRDGRTPHISETNPVAWERRKYFQSHRDEFSGYSADELEDYLDGR